MYSKFFKASLDKILGFFFLLIVMPLFVLIVIILIFPDTENPFFFQERVGTGGKVFKIIKFKTMKDLRDKNGRILPDKERLTKTGSLIRSASLDELPQIINVLKGDMSLIGPRPLLVSYLPLYNEHQARRHEVKPGITGWAQVNGRNAISWQEKFDLDVWYVDNISFRLDMKILFKTVINIVKRTGINSPDATTMKPFTGNN
ncbi:MAG: Undecaprenyl phosphate N,N'-diacetylbacillosamine 1-phosphate transferase [Ignavibacteria bacterium ADurb.Bin266]|nr:MAG: Undecaprenyl phosphate N,N'-diacetylbacillosamine 1-phosphate transferase [Ignavibacteria bacterium ADurb.Bin266]